MSEVVTVEECESGIRAQYGYAASTFDAQASEEMQATYMSITLENLISSLKGFLVTYVVLPPKDIVLSAFERIVDSVLQSMELPLLVRRFFKRAAMAFAEATYDAIAASKRLASM